MLAPGTTLGRYQVIAPLGYGGMATVYRAYHPKLDRVVALKVIRTEITEDPGFIKRFNREAQAIARLDHPNIVQVFDFDEADGMPFLAMQYLEGGSLKQLLVSLATNDSSMSWGEIQTILTQVANALGYAHERGIVHRNVKPANVLLAADGRAVVTDFGIAKMASGTQLTQTGVGIGTPEYMSPEQGQGLEVDGRSDIYSLGVMAFEMFTGRLPFTADTPVAIVLKHVRDPIPLPSALDQRIGQDLERTLLKALAKDPNDRFQTAAEFADGMGRARSLPARQTIATVPIVRGRSVERGVRLSRGPLAALVAAALVVGGVIVGGGFPQWRLAFDGSRASPSPTALQGGVGGPSAPSPGASPVAIPQAASAKVKIVSSLPMTGPSLTQTQSIVNAIKMALEEVNSKVGNVTIEYESLDDATPAKQNWDPAKEAENARKAVSDPAVVAYIGTYNSGAAAVSIPILCAANLVMVSPANTYPGLTKAGKGEAGEPDKYYPGGCKRNYTRVVPADDIQGAVGAKWMKELGGKSVYIVHDNELYGKGVADVFRTTARQLGIQEAGYEGVLKADNFRGLASRVAASGADFVYYGGLTDNNPGFLLRDLKAAKSSIKFMSVDGVAETEFINQAGAAAEGAYVTFGGIPVSSYTGASKAWADKYRQRYGSSLLYEVYAIYGYEAAKVVLKAIERAGAKATDRATIRDNVFATKDFEGVLGQKWSFNAEGDTSITTMAGMIVQGRDFKFLKELS